MVGIDIDRASTIVNLTRLEAEALLLASFLVKQEPGDSPAARCPVPDAG